MQANTERPSLSIEPGFAEAVWEILELHPDGLSEYNFIKQLKARGFFAFLEPRPAPPHVLFCAHFLLFHTLYRLRDAEHGARRATLTISPFLIERRPYLGAKPGLEQNDPLYEYYSDLSNLEVMDEAQVRQLLDGFWQQIEQREHRQEALEVLGLADPVDNATIKKTYKRLAMIHHPDRGGSSEHLQAIHTAMNRLLGSP